MRLCTEATVYRWPNAPETSLIPSTPAPEGAKAALLPARGGLRAEVEVAQKRAVGGSGQTTSARNFRTGTGMSLYGRDGFNKDADRLDQSMGK